MTPIGLHGAGLIGFVGGVGAVACLVSTDGERVLVATKDQRFMWVPLAEFHPDSKGIATADDILGEG